MAASSALDSVSTELKLLVLRQISDIDILSAIVHASPGFHNVYASVREEIFTMITLRELLARNINFTTGITSAGLNVPEGVKPTQELQDALKMLCNQLTNLPAPGGQGSVNRIIPIGSFTAHLFNASQRSELDSSCVGYSRIRLSVAHCLALLKLERWGGLREVARSGKGRGLFWILLSTNEANGQWTTYYFETFPNSYRLRKHYFDNGSQGDASRDFPNYFLD